MSKNLKKILFVLVGLLLANFISSSFFTRFDLTKDKRYTLSDVSKNIVNKLDNNLIVNVYLEGDFPSEFKRLQIETRQFLEELQAENTNIRFRFINPDDIREELVKLGVDKKTAEETKGKANLLGLLNKVKCQPSTLSGGEQQRVGIARAIVNSPPLLLADEPTGNLDPELSMEILKLFEDFNRHGTAVLIATHDLGLIARMKYKSLTLDHGRLITDPLAQGVL